MTFPTKQFYVDSLYGTVPAAPFEHAFESGVSPVEIGGTVFDREQISATFGGACGTLCPPGQPAALLYQVNVLGVGGPADDATSRVLGSTLDAVFLPTAFDARAHRSRSQRERAARHPCEFSMR